MALTDGESAATSGGQRAATGTTTRACGSCRARGPHRPARTRARAEDAQARARDARAEKRSGRRRREVQESRGTGRARRAARACGEKQAHATAVGDRGAGGCEWKQLGSARRVRFEEERLLVEGRAICSTIGQGAHQGNSCAG